LAKIGLGLRFCQESRANEVGEQGPDIPPAKGGKGPEQYPAKSEGPDTPHPGGQAGKNNNPHGLAHCVLVGFNLFIKIDIKFHRTNQPIRIAPC
jgi:hypothetical protein